MDLENLMALQAVALRLHQTQTGDAGAERSTTIQVLGEEVEQRCKALLGEVRGVRGYGGEAEDHAPRIAFEANGNGNGHHDDDAEDGRKFNGAKVRDAMLQFRSFTMKELIVHCKANYDDVTDAKVREFVKAWCASNPPRVKEDGKIGREIVFVYVPPEPAPVNREKRTPVERTVDPAFTESRANGQAVRVPHMSRLTRKQRSTSHTAHLARQKDARHDKMVKAQETRAAQQAGKAEQARVNGTKKKGGANGNGGGDVHAFNQRSMEAAHIKPSSAKRKS